MLARKKSILQRFFCGFLEIQTFWFIDAIGPVFEGKPGYHASLLGPVDDSVFCYWYGLKRK